MGQSRLCPISPQPPSDPIGARYSALTKRRRSAATEFIERRRMELHLTIQGEDRLRNAARCVLGVLFVMSALGSWAIAQVQIPGPGQGYEITKSDSSQPAPSGYEGRTDASMQTAVGNTPATAGKSIITHFTLGNQIKTCPQLDGTAEGTGVFSISLDSTDAQENGTTKGHIEMRANAKYKGQVGDDGFLQGPVNAEIDYSYTQTGSYRDKSGAIANTTPSEMEQHITIPILVSKGLNAPDFGAFAGGDPTQGHYSEALGAGMALAYWAGVYYGVAETKWLQGHCVDIVFNPPAHTLQPVLGGQTTVTAELKTKGGESVKAQFQGAHVYSGGGFVSTLVGVSDVGAPAKFVYTAPAKKVQSAGFGVSATSRAGVPVEGEWRTGLGTGWSGQITCTREFKGDEGQNELQTWSNSGAARMVITVKDGVGDVSTHREMKSVAINRRKALRGGAMVLLPDTSFMAEGSADDTGAVGLRVTIDKATGKYSISLTDAGKVPAPSTPNTAMMHGVECTEDRCTPVDTPIGVDTGFNGASGTFDDPNHVKGSKSEVKTEIGRAHNGTMTWTLDWNLARQGTTK